MELHNAVMAPSAVGHLHRLFAEQTGLAVRCSAKQMLDSEVLDSQQAFAYSGAVETFIATSGPVASAPSSAFLQSSQGAQRKDHDSLRRQPGIRSTPETGELGFSL